MGKCMLKIIPAATKTTPCLPKSHFCCPFITDEDIIVIDDYSQDEFYYCLRSQTSAILDLSRQGTCCSSSRSKVIFSLLSE